MIKIFKINAWEHWVFTLFLNLGVFLFSHSVSKIEGYANSLSFCCAFTLLMLLQYSVQAIEITVFEKGLLLRNKLGMWKKRKTIPWQNIIEVAYWYSKGETIMIIYLKNHTYERTDIYILQKPKELWDLLQKQGIKVYESNFYKHIRRCQELQIKRSKIFDSPWVIMIFSFLLLTSFCFGVLAFFYLFSSLGI